MRIRLIAVGRCRDKVINNLVDRYLKRCTWSVTVHEIAAQRTLEADATLIGRRIGNDPYVTLDERGDLLSSNDFANRLQGLRLDGIRDIAFVIGGADGLDQSLKNQASSSIALGRLTWPHMLVRVLLVEQLYRASCILSGHPYHRE